MSEKSVVLTSSDGDSFEINEAIVLQMKTIGNYVLDDDDTNSSNNVFQLPNITSKILILVIEYCKKHAETDSLSEEYLKKWDTEFMNTDISTITGLIQAANYLNSENLLNLCCQTIADKISSCNQDYKLVREKLEIKNDFTPEEEANLLKEFHWVFE